MLVEGKVIIITGASSGIGMATAKLLTHKGAKVALVSRSEEKLEAVSKILPDSFVVVTDMSKENQVRDMVQKVTEHFGTIDILINNAGIGYDAPIEKTDINKFRYLFDLDVVGPLVAMQSVIPIMRKNNKGSIINISSGTALMSLPNMGAYSSLKRALAGISLTADEELQHDNINVCVIYPYMTNTDFEKNTLKDMEDLRYPEDVEHYSPPPADPPEFVAEKILEAIELERNEIVAHEWMRKTS